MAFLCLFGVRNTYKMKRSSEMQLITPRNFSLNIALTLRGRWEKIEYISWVSFILKFHFIFGLFCKVNQVKFCCANEDSRRAVHFFHFRKKVVLQNKWRNGCQNSHCHAQFESLAVSSPRCTQYAWCACARYAVATLQILLLLSEDYISLARYLILPLRFEKWSYYNMSYFCVTFICLCCVKGGKFSTISTISSHNDNIYMLCWMIRRQVHLALENCTTLVANVVVCFIFWNYTFNFNFSMLILQHINHSSLNSVVLENRRY